jgi:hypothetical protein
MVDHYIGSRSSATWSVKDMDHKKSGLNGFSQCVTSDDLRQLARNGQPPSETNASVIPHDLQQKN